MNGSPGKGKIPKSPLEKVGWESPQIPTGLNPQGAKDLFPFGANPPELANGEAIQEVRNLWGRNDLQPVRFPQRTGQLGNQFIGSRSYRTRQPQVIENRFLNGLGDPPLGQGKTKRQWVISRKASSMDAACAAAFDRSASLNLGSAAIFLSLVVSPLSSAALASAGLTSAVPPPANPGAPR